MRLLKIQDLFSEYVTSHGKTYNNGYPLKRQKAFSICLLSVKGFMKPFNPFAKPFLF